MITEKTCPIFLDPKRLEDLASRFGDAYRTGEPFPHIVLDDFLPEEVLEGVLSEFPKPSEIRWIKLVHDHSKKLASNDETQMGDFTRSVFHQFNSSVFINFLEKLTGIEPLIPDPHLFGGGLHQIEKGGHLGVHVDFNYHPKLKLERRLNLLLFLNKDWREEYGGHLELWNRGMTRCEKKLLPIFNRCVIFNTSEYSFHGHPVPLTCPEDRTRRSLALYYYSSLHSAEDLAVHSTLYQGGKKKKSLLAKSVLKKLLPPLFLDLWRLLRH